MATPPPEQNPRLEMYRQPVRAINSYNTTERDYLRIIGMHRDGDIAKFTKYVYAKSMLDILESFRTGQVQVEIPMLGLRTGFRGGSTHRLHTER